MRQTNITVNNTLNNTHHKSFFSSKKPSIKQTENKQTMSQQLNKYIHKHIKEEKRNLSQCKYNKIIENEKQKKKKNEFREKSLIPPLKFTPK